MIPNKRTTIFRAIFSGVRKIVENISTAVMRIEMSSGFLRPSLKDQRLTEISQRSKITYDSVAIRVRQARVVPPR